MHSLKSARRNRRYIVPVSYSRVHFRFSDKEAIGYRDILLNLEVGWTIKYVCMCVCNGACVLARMSACLFL